LTSGQKAAVALEILPMLEGEAAERRRATQNNNTAKAVSQKFDTQVIEPARAAEQAAQIVGTNRQYVSDAKRIKEQSPAVFEQVKAGAMTLNDAKREVRETERKQQREQLKERAALTPKSNRYQIGICDFRTGNQLADNSVDFIITDPPYPQEFLPLWHDLAEFAARVLKPNGVLIAMSGQTYLPQVMSMLSEHLTYEWMLAYTTPGGQAVQVFPRKVNTFWKPVLLYSKDGRSGDWFGDVCKSSTNDNDKRFHEWGQSESGFMDLMRRFVRPDDLVVDPFMGAGTTGVCAMALGARFVGYEINGEHGAIAAARIEEAANVSSL
jgi:site-specific DNA-methyltransferase (adenine-specific)